MCLALMALWGTLDLWHSASCDEPYHPCFDKNFLKDCNTAEAGGTDRTGLLSPGNSTVAAHLRVRSVHVVTQLLQCWRFALTSEECLQIRDYCTGVVSSEDNEPNPHIIILPNLPEISGPLLGDKEKMHFNTASGKIPYKSCVNILNKKSLSRSH